MSDYDKFQEAFIHLNEVLFDGELPNIYLTLRNHSPDTLGYFAPEQFRKREGEGVRHELSMCPTHFLHRSDRQILATLAHEMCHLWQEAYGKPGKGGYHNREWGEKMLKIGLTPVNNNNPKRMTGRSVYHEIVEAGPFDAAAQALLTQGWTLQWGERPRAAAANEGKQKARRQLSKILFECPCCGAKAWAKWQSVLLCGECSSPYAFVELEPDKEKLDLLLALLKE